MQTKLFLACVALCGLSYTVRAQQTVNDSNTPLHMQKPNYHIDYRIPTVDEVKATMDRVLVYIDKETPARLVDRRTGQDVKQLADIDENTQLARGGFRLTSYEWGVT